MYRVFLACPISKALPMPHSMRVPDCVEPENPWFFRGQAGEGIGGPHIGRNSIWPMSQIMYALTSNSNGEIEDSIQILKAASAGTGFMHESYNADDSKRFTRRWFAWANSLFGELVAKTIELTPGLLG